MPYDLMSRIPAMAEVLSPGACPFGRTIFVFHKSFVPEGCTNGTATSTLAITFGAGTMDREAFEFAAEHDVVVVGGTDGTVGLVG